MSLGLIVNKDKIGAILEYICYQIPHIQLRKLLKIIYMIDEDSVRQRAFPITWLDYYAWQKGPVAPEVYAVKAGEFSQYVSCTKSEEDGKWYVSPKHNAQFPIEQAMKQCSRWEQDLVAKVTTECKDKTADQLTEETHCEDSLWTKVVSQNNIDFSDSPKSECQIDFNMLNFGNQQFMNIYEDAEDSIYMQSLINKASCSSQAN